jgi:transposase
MTLLPSGVKIHVALGVTDMRKGLDGLAMLVQGTLKQDPFSGHLFLFRGRKASLLKIIFWDGTGLCLFTKRLEQSRFFWPGADEATGSVMLTQAQLSMLIEGIDWRSPERQWRPSVPGTVSLHTGPSARSTERARPPIPPQRGFVCRRTAGPFKAARRSDEIALPSDSLLRGPRWSWGEVALGSLVRRHF